MTLDMCVGQYLFVLELKDRQPGRRMIRDADGIDTSGRNQYAY